MLTMTLALLAVLIAGALCLGMISAFLPFQRPREEIELAEFTDDEFFDIGGPIIDLQATR
ncbi:hypothetical protein SAMN02799625_01499 [Methylobacterium sp. UNC300MFChir4.1]|jgi:hypothetical protein|nr:hypothetical protein SAMN04488144_12752 [Methylobacterium sp. 190mf]SEH28738.1 hypothetical protein SAMN02799636_00649 [Methylobacterium sp. 275MFSha3.1]SEN52005.1 hypothetical protein SAMN02799625_01499 [Methylobacterium sp. UNC300MFChir4.1]SFD28913.1 hypothetical protein SAMN02799627_00046 [Methylobacterium sp. 13MFTsu3.1M2]